MNHALVEVGRNTRIVVANSDKIRVCEELCKQKKVEKG